VCDGSSFHNLRAVRPEHRSGTIFAREVHMPSSPLVIVSDVDGTLLDHRGQWFTTPALLRHQVDALSRRAPSGVVVVLASSRTIDELVTLQRCLGLHGPCIGEDGAVVAIDSPVDARALEHAARTRGGRAIVHRDEIIRGRRTLSILRIGAPSTTIRQRLRAWPSMTADLACASAQRLQSLGFVTARHQQRALRSRRASVLLDPVQWRANQRAAAGGWPALNDLDIERGGRWLTATIDAGKGPASEFLRAYLNATTLTACHLVGIGDGANDQSLLRTVDLAFAVPDGSGRIHPTLGEIPQLIALPHDHTAWPDMLAHLVSALPPAGSSAHALAAAGGYARTDFYTHDPEGPR
jgi:mannosyl-3-phosphoglycerate phosphatase